MWYSPSLSGHPTIRDVCRLLSPYCLDCGWALHHAGTAKGNGCHGRTWPEALTSSALALLPGALLKKLTTSCQINNRGIREDSCFCCFKEVVIQLKTPSVEADNVLPATTQQRKSRLWLGEKKEYFPKPQSCMQTLSCDLLSCFHNWPVGQVHKYRMSDAKGQWSRWSFFEARSRVMGYTLDPYSSLSPMLYPTPLLLSCSAPGLRNKRTIQNLILSLNTISGVCFAVNIMCVI